MKRLDGRVAIVTGAGSGLGRAHATFLAAEGASVVVNDIGGDVRGVGSDPEPAERVVREIREAGGRAVASGHDVADWDQARELTELAVETFGDLHVLVNNAGIVRDRTVANLSEDEWDAVIRVNLKGHAAPTIHAVAYWRRQAKEGGPVAASVVHTTSAAGLTASFGQANYAAAKLAVVALSRAVALEAGRYGVRSNAISPSSRTRLSLTAPGAEEWMRSPGAGGRDLFDPANVSPLVAWLARAECPATDQVFHVFGKRVFVISTAVVAHELTTEDGWTLDGLDRELPSRLIRPLDLGDLIEV